MRSLWFFATAFLLAAPAALAACGGGGEGSTDLAGAVLVVSTNDACMPAQTTFPAGPVKLAVKNSGSDSTELYLYDSRDKVVAEVENVGPGTSRSISATLVAGSKYTISCKPGGKEIKVPITVS